MNPPIGPRESHLIEQLQALSLEIGVRKKQLKDDLMEAGLSEVEAWEQAARFEERVMGSAMDKGAQLLPVAELADRFVRELLDSM